MHIPRTYHLHSDRYIVLSFGFDEQSNMHLMNKRLGYGRDDYVFPKSHLISFQTLSYDAFLSPPNNQNLSSDWVLDHEMCTEVKYAISGLAHKILSYNPPLFSSLYAWVINNDTENLNLKRPLSW